MGFTKSRFYGKLKNMNINKILIPVSIIIAGIAIAGALVYINQEKVSDLSSEESPSFQAVAEKAIDYINKNKDTLTNGATASLISVTEEGDILKMRLMVGDQEFDSYVTKDGKFLFPGGYVLEEESLEEPAAGEANSETVKEDVPDVKLFVMSYCPYGLQAQKMFLPVYDLLKDKVNMGVYFVDYIMHEKQEIDENLRQYCIQKEQKGKYYDYLSCFVADGDFEKCLSQTNIDKTNLTACVSNTDQEYSITSQYNDKNTWLNGTYPKFGVQAGLNDKYGVQGSPTVVINDKIVNINPRSPEKFKEVVCQSFNSLPEECSQALSSESPSPGFGGGTGSGSSGQCQ